LEIQGYGLAIKSEYKDTYWKKATTGLKNALRKNKKAARQAAKKAIAGEDLD
jgi:hypothetical protein